MKRKVLFCVLAICVFFSLTASAELSFMQSKTYSFGTCSAYYNDWTNVRTVNLTSATSGISINNIKLKWTVDSLPTSGGYVQRVRLYRDGLYHEYAVGSTQTQLTITDFSGASMGHTWQVQFLVNGAWITSVDSSITFNGIAVAIIDDDDPIIY